MQCLNFCFGQQQKTQKALLATGANLSYCNLAFAEVAMRDLCIQMEDTSMHMRTCTGKFDLIGKITIPITIHLSKKVKYKHKLSLLVLDTTRKGCHVTLGCSFIFHDDFKAFQIDKLIMKNGQCIMLHQGDADEKTK